MNTPIESIEARIKELEEARSRARTTLASVEDELRVALEKKVELICCVRVGSTVEFQGSRYQVTWICTDHWYSSKPWLKARKIKKDGTPAMNDRQLYGEWTVTTF
jgi:hypothetical protein